MWHEIVSGITQVAVALAAVVGARVAWVGLSTWKDQLHGKANHELARRYLRAVYRVRDEIETVRNPMMTVADLGAHRTSLGDSSHDNESERPSWQAIHEARLTRVASALSDLKVEAIEGAVLWDLDGNTVTGDLRKCAEDLRYAILGFYKSGQNPTSSWKAHQEVLDWVFHTGLDKFGKRVDAAVETAEGHLRPRLYQ